MFASYMLDGTLHESAVLAQHKRAQLMLCGTSVILRESDLPAKCKRAIHHV